MIFTVKAKNKKYQDKKLSKKIDY